MGEMVWGLERMVTDRLLHRLEQRTYFSVFQSGFRLGRATMDSVLLLEREVKRALVNKEMVIGVLLDIEKEYACCGKMV